MRALTHLNRAGQAAQAVPQQVKGKPDEMPLNKIMRDLDNPRPPLDLRTSEEQQKQRELNANIKKRGVKSPISLRPHPTISDMWIINHGHCRYDGAKEAGLPAIPYFIDPNFDSYDQVAENLHRADLSPWSIAEFIKRKLGEKQTKGQIAEGLGKESESYISEHLALVDAPKCLHQAYKNGVQSTRTLYDLRRAYEEFPEQIELWCDAEPKITRDTIRDLLKVLRAGREQAVEGGTRIQLPQDPVASEFGHDEARALASPPTSFPAATAHQEKPAHERPPQPPAAADLHQIENTPPSGSLASNAPEFRHGEKRPASTEGSLTAEGSHRSNSVVRALYKGKPATITPNTTVKILVEGRNGLLEVPLSELVFPGIK
jgi:ParB family chromosome partitioning protein